MLLIGPMPPPIGGDTISFHKLVNNDIFNRFFDIKVISTRPVHLRAERDIIDVVRFFLVMFELSLHIFKYKTIFFNINRGFAVTGYLIPFLLCKLLRRKIILKTFGGGLDRLIDTLHPLHKKIVIRVFKSTDLLLPQTHQLCKWFKGEGFKTYLFPNWVPDDYLQYKNIKNKKNFIFIGQIKREKGVFNLINSMHLFPDVECHFFGPILNCDKNEFFKEIKLSKNCRYHGILAREHLGDTIENYKFLILPTFYPGEGIPAVLLESIAKGVPVISSRKGGITDIIDSDNGILFDTEKELTKAISIANNMNIQNYKKMANAGVRTAEGYTDTVVIANLCQRLNVLINA